jgi:hypothetical protein
MERRGGGWLGGGLFGRWEAPVVEEREPQTGGGVGHGHATDAGQLRLLSWHEEQRLLEYQSVSQGGEWPNGSWPWGWESDEKSRRGLAKCWVCWDLGIFSNPRCREKNLSVQWEGANPGGTPSWLGKYC